MFVSIHFFLSLFQVKDGKLVYLFEDTLSGHMSEFAVDAPVTDGLWHVLSLFSNGKNTFLFLDGNSVSNITHHSMEFTPVTVEKIILGAAVTGHSKLQHSGEIHSNS